MKVSLLYVCSFLNSAQKHNAETNAVVQGLQNKYTERNIPILAIQGTTASGLEKCLASGPALDKRLGYRDKQAEPFRPLRESSVPKVNMDATRNPYGVGVFHVFHGTTCSSDINPEATARLTKLIIDRHPPGCVRKVSVIACAYADTHSHHQRSQLQKLGEALVRLEVPLPLLASYSGTVNPKGNGKAYDGKVFLRPLNGAYVPAQAQDWHDP